MRIMSLEGSVVFKNDGFTATKYGKPDSKAFRGVLDESLDTLKLAEVYDRHKSELAYPYLDGKKRFCRAVVSLSFNRAIKLYESYGNRYVLNGHSVTDEDMQDQLRNMLKPFYGVLKTMDGAIRFALLTGVTKFGKVSVFSDLNNLMDISMDDRYVEICGITEKEIHTCLEDEVRELAGAQDMTYEETCLRLKECYDGYHFVENSIGMYNPFSLLNTFRSLEFGSYWFETGTPTYLVKLLKDNNFCLPDLTSEGVTAETLTDVESFKDNPIAVIYQSGYLTIKEYDEEFNIYRLGFPNKEVAEGFIKYLVPYYMPIKDSESVY